MESKPEPDDLYARRESYKPKEMLPIGVLMLTAGVDVQKNRLEVLIMGWGMNAEKWGVHYEVIQGSPMEPITWQKLDALLSRPWARALGPPLKPVCTFVDSGKWTDSIYKYTRTRMKRGVFACKGAKAIDRPLMDGKPTKQGRPPTLLYNVGTHEAKDLIYQWLDLEPPAEDGEHPMGYCHFPKTEEFGPNAGGDATGFFEMLLAEDSVMRRSTQTGEFVRFFDCPKGVRNEALDVFVYALAAERRMRPKYDLMLQKLV
jgi:phage terminase large subunit GpA-like protein